MTEGPTGRFEYDLFVSYSSWDREAAHDLVRLLRTRCREARPRLFFAAEEALPDELASAFRDLDDYGERYEGRYLRWLTDALKRSRHCVALVSTRYLSSPWCRLELQGFANLASADPRRTLEILLQNDCRGQLPDELDGAVSELPPDAQLASLADRIAPPDVDVAASSVSGSLFQPLPLAVLWMSESSRRLRPAPWSHWVAPGPTAAEYELAVREEMIREQARRLVFRHQGDAIERTRAEQSGPFLERAARAARDALADVHEGVEWRLERVRSTLEFGPAEASEPAWGVQARDDARALLEAGVSPIRGPLRPGAFEQLEPGDTFASIRDRAGVSDLEMDEVCWLVGRAALKRGLLDTVRDVMDRPVVRRCFVEAYQWTAMTHYLQGAYQPALDELERLGRSPGPRAAEPAPPDPTAASRRLGAVCLARLGRAAAAASERARAMELEPDYTVEAEPLIYLTPQHLDDWLGGLREAGFT